MTNDIFNDDDDDRHAARRSWNAYLAAVDAELADEARSQYRCETDIGKAIQPEPLPFVVDCGANTTRRDREAIQAEQDRWTRLERMGR